MIGLSEGLSVALVGACSAIIVACVALAGNWVITRETRRRNSAEHDQGRVERLESEARLSARLDSIDGRQEHMIDLIVQHVSDTDAHGG